MFPLARGHFYRRESEGFVKTTVKAGISFGSCLAMVMSYTSWRSVFWAVLHGLMGWVYVVYHMIRY